MKQRPMLYVGELSQRVFLATRWTRTGGAFEALEKHDVTDQFVAVARELSADWWNEQTELVSARTNGDGAREGSEASA